MIPSKEQILKMVRIFIEKIYCENNMELHASGYTYNQVTYIV